MAATTLFSLKTDASGAFDGASRGIAVSAGGQARQLKTDGAFRLDKGRLQLARHADLDALESFTLEATIKPKSVGRARRNVMEAQSPPVALFVEDGKLTGSVHTQDGWKSIDSGETRIAAGQAARVGFTRDGRGRMRLLLNGKTVGRGAAKGGLRPVGETGFTIGAWVDGAKHPFSGEIKGVEIARGALNPKAAAKVRSAERRLVQGFKRKTGLKRVEMRLNPNYGNSRLQPIKDIMNAAGVEKLSDLQTLD
ncbi:MAG: LamG-like jellyroll fold domain-containing protein, partial [Pseudomonadota bacterium]